MEEGQDPMSPLLNAGGIFQSTGGYSARELQTIQPLASAAAPQTTKDLNHAAITANALAANANTFAQLWGAELAVSRRL